MRKNPLNGAKVSDKPLTKLFGDLKEENKNKGEKKKEKGYSSFFFGITGFGLIIAGLYFNKTYLMIMGIITGLYFIFMVLERINKKEFSGEYSCPQCGVEYNTIDEASRCYEECLAPTYECPVCYKEYNSIDEFRSCWKKCVKDKEEGE